MHAVLLKLHKFLMFKIVQSLVGNVFGEKLTATLSSYNLLCAALNKKHSLRILIVVHCTHDVPSGDTAMLTKLTQNQYTQKSVLSSHPRLASADAAHTTSTTAWCNSTHVCFLMWPAPNTMMTLLQLRLAVNPMLTKFSLIACSPTLHSRLCSSCTH